MHYCQSSLKIDEFRCYEVAQPTALDWQVALEIGGHGVIYMNTTEAINLGMLLSKTAEKIEGGLRVTNEA